MQNHGRRCSPSISKESVVLIFTLKCTCVELIASTDEKARDSVLATEEKEKKNPFINIFFSTSSSNFHQSNWICPLSLPDLPMVS